MVRSLTTVIIYLLANSIGLLVATILLPGFSIGILSFVLAVVLFTIIEAVAGFLLTKYSRKHAPALTGSVALITTFAGIFFTSLFLEGMTIGGISNLLAATLLVWVSTLVAGLILPKLLLKKKAAP